MKNLLTIALCLLAYQLIYAQRNEIIKNKEVKGIYLTISDFKNGILTLPIDKKHKEDKIKLNQFLISSEIICCEQNFETVFYKDSIFAINLTNGKNYRFINNNPFLIADTSELYIYTYRTIKTEHKISGPHRRTKEIPITYYYFSFGDHKTTYLLTLANLGKYVLTDPLIYSELINTFPNDEMLLKINPETGRFAINESIVSILKKS